MATSPVRIPQETHDQARKMAALSGETPGDLLAIAWKEYLENHRAEFANELQQAAEVVRNGSLDDLAAFAGRNNEEKARQATARVRSNR